MIGKTGFAEGSNTWSYFKIQNRNVVLKVQVKERGFRGDTYMQSNHLTSPSDFDVPDEKYIK